MAKNFPDGDDIHPGPERGRAEVVPEQVEVEFHPGCLLDRDGRPAE